MRPCVFAPAQATVTSGNLSGIAELFIEILNKQTYFSSHGCAAVTKQTIDDVVAKINEVMQGGDENENDGGAEDGGGDEESGGRGRGAKAAQSEAAQALYAHAMKKMEALGL